MWLRRQICCEQFTQEALVLPQFEKILGAKPRVSKTVFVCGKSECVHRKGARGCVSVLGADKERVYECVSIHVDLLVSHPAALVHQQRCHVAEWISALMDESNLLPTQIALLLAWQKVLRKVPLHSHFYSVLKNNVYVCSAAHTASVFFWRLNDLCAWPWNSESLLITQERNLISSPTSVSNWRSRLDWWCLRLSFFLFLVSECCFMNVQCFLCAIKDFPQVLHLPHTLHCSKQPEPSGQVLMVDVVCEWPSSHHGFLLLA